MRTFKTIFQERYGVQGEAYIEKVLWKAVYRKPFSLIVNAVDKHYFLPDRYVIRKIGAARSREEFKDITNAFYIRELKMKSFLRYYMKIRLSINKLERLFDEVMTAEAQQNREPARTVASR